MTTQGILEGKICVVTGATAGIGLEAACALARLGAQVLLVGRNQERGQAAAARIAEETGRPAGTFLPCDLSVLDQVRDLADRIRSRSPRLDVLVNNAGAMYGERAVTAQGVEMTLAVNHLAPFVLTNLLLAPLRAAAGRVVTVASVAHRRTRFDFDDPHFARRRYHGWRAYQQSKLANILFTYELARRLEPETVTANALHPGFVATEIGTANGLVHGLLWRLACRFGRSAPRGAETIVHLAAAPEVAAVTGRYFVDCRPAHSSPASYDRDAARRLWASSAAWAGMPEPIRD